MAKGGGERGVGEECVQGWWEWGRSMLGGKGVEGGVGREGKDMRVCV